MCNTMSSNTLKNSSKYNMNNKKTHYTCLVQSVTKLFVREREKKNYSQAVCKCVRNIFLSFAMVISSQFRESLIKSLLCLDNITIWCRYCDYNTIVIHVSLLFFCLVSALLCYTLQKVTNTTLRTISVAILSFFSLFSLCCCTWSKSKRIATLLALRKTSAKWYIKIFLSCYNNKSRCPNPIDGFNFSLQLVKNRHKFNTCPTVFIYTCNRHSQSELQAANQTAAAKWMYLPGHYPVFYTFPSKHLLFIKHAEWQDVSVCSYAAKSSVLI